MQPPQPFPGRCQGKGSHWSWMLHPCSAGATGAAPVQTSSRREGLAPAVPALGSALWHSRKRWPGSCLALLQETGPFSLSSPHSQALAVEQQRWCCRRCPGVWSPLAFYLLGFPLLSRSHLNGRERFAFSSCCCELELHRERKHHRWEPGWSLMPAQLRLQALPAPSHRFSTSAAALAPVPAPLRH